MAAEMQIDSFVFLARKVLWTRGRIIRIAHDWIAVVEISQGVIGAERVWMLDVAC